MKQVFKKIEITMLMFALLGALSILEMTILEGTTKKSESNFNIDKYNTIFQNE
ncbi:MAG: hypothetical protein PHW02_04930 [bacterium]|nr:hypothetical protein [bacterium]